MIYSDGFADSDRDREITLVTARRFQFPHHHPERQRITRIWLDVCGCLRPEDPVINPVALAEWDALVKECRGIIT